MILFRVGKLIDGTGAKPLEGAALRVEGNRIRAVGRQADISAPEGARVVDAPDPATDLAVLRDRNNLKVFLGGNAIT